MFLSLVLIQVLVLNHIQFSGYINPYMYVLFVLLLPVSLPRYAVLILAFLLGISIDIFSNTLGLHTSSTVFLAFLRPFVFNIISAKEMDRSEFPGVKQYGLRWFVSYSGILIFAHHFFFFYIEVFTMAGFFHTFLRVILSSVFSLFMVVLSQYLIFRE